MISALPRVPLKPVFRHFKFIFAKLKFQHFLSGRSTFFFDFGGNGGRCGWAVVSATFVEINILQITYNFFGNI